MNDATEQLDGRYFGWVETGLYPALASYEFPEPVSGVSEQPPGDPTEVIA